MPMDWVWGFVGGLMIGCAGAAYLLLNGRIMGVSGVMGALVDRSGWSDGWERAAFLLGTFALPFLIVPGLWATETHLSANWLVVIGGGLLVGLGTRLAGGCTSGHGVCGISRLSLRGIIATVFYILAGGITLAALRHGLGLV